MGVGLDDGLSVAVAVSVGVVVGVGVKVGVALDVSVVVGVTESVGEDVTVWVTVGVIVPISVGVSRSSVAVASGVRVSMGASVSVTSGRRKLHALRNKATAKIASALGSKSPNSPTVSIQVAKPASDYNIRRRETLMGKTNCGTALRAPKNQSIAGMVRAEVPPAPSLALDQSFDLGSDAGLVQDTEPAPDNLSLRIDKHVLCLRGDSELAPDVVQ